jgi:hypothetical protein
VQTRIGRLQRGDRRGDIARQCEAVCGDAHQVLDLGDDPAIAILSDLLAQGLVGLLGEFTLTTQRRILLGELQGVCVETLLDANRSSRSPSFCQTRKVPPQASSATSSAITASTDLPRACPEPVACGGGRAAASCPVPVAWVVSSAVSATASPVASASAVGVDASVSCSLRSESVIAFP